jgi:hypothetical protein
VPDTVHEAVRDLTRAREVAMIDLRKKRQQVLSFLLRHVIVKPSSTSSCANRVRPSSVGF